MLNNPTLVNTTEFLSGNATATATGIVTIPANRYFSLDIQLSGSQSGVGTATPRVTLTTTSTAGTFSPPNNSVVARLSITGLLGIVASSSSVTELSGYSGDVGMSLDFNVGGGTASCVITGALF
jgi:hypothetical protein